MYSLREVELIAASDKMIKDLLKTSYKMRDAGISEPESMTISDERLKIKVTLFTDDCLDGTGHRIEAFFSGKVQIADKCGPDGLNLGGLYLGLTNYDPHEDDNGYC